MEVAAKKASAFLTAFAMIALTIFVPFAQVTPSAEEAEEELYTINGYKDNCVIKDSDGNVIEGIAFCLDSKAETPSASEGAIYKKTKLSEIESYSKTTREGDTVEMVLTDRSKVRLLKLLVNEKAVERYVRKLRREKMDTEVEHVCDILYNIVNNDDESMGKLWGNIPATEWNAYKENPTEENYQLLENMVVEKFKTHWNTFSSSDATQRLVWAFVHDDDKWSEFVLDDGSLTSGHAGNYYTVEGNYFYYSPNPMEDEYSLWNVFYQPAIEYVDTFPDYFELGYDADVFITENETYQNINYNLYDS